MGIRLGKCISGKYAKELFDKESLERSREMKDELDRVASAPQTRILPTAQGMSPKNRMSATEASMLEIPTLRDQFAMAALTGLYSEKIQETHVGIAKLAYMIADAMLEARG